MTESNCPAIDESDVSSTTDELRGDERRLVAGGTVEGLAHGGVRVDVGARVDRVGERGREHDAGQRGETGGLTAFARAAAFPPVSVRSSARSSRRSTTKGRSSPVSSSAHPRAAARGDHARRDDARP